MPHILIVDDDPTIVRLVRMILEMEDYEVSVASNGREGLEAVAAQLPDLVLCDVMMPVLGGLEVVAQLRREPATADLPVVMLSAKAQEVDIKHGTGAGADAYITKPFEPDDLLAVIADVLGAAAARGSGQPGDGTARASRARGKKQS